MPEPYDPSPLLKPGFLRDATVWDDGRELAEKIATEADPDRLADLIEQAVEKTDLCHVVIMSLVFRMRNAGDPGSLIELQAEPTAWQGARPLFVVMDEWRERRPEPFAPVGVVNHHSAKGLHQS